MKFQCRTNAFCSLEQFLYSDHYGFTSNVNLLVTLEFCIQLELCWPPQLPKLLLFWLTNPVSDNVKCNDQITNLRITWMTALDFLTCPVDILGSIYEKKVCRDKAGHCGLVVRVPGSLRSISGFKSRPWQSVFFLLAFFFIFFLSLLTVCTYSHTYSSVNTCHRRGKKRVITENPSSSIC